MSTLGLRTSKSDISGIGNAGSSGGSRNPAILDSENRGSSEGSLPAWLKYLDLVVLVLALPVFIAGGLPIAGYLVGGGAWVVQRVVQALFMRRASASDDPRTIVGFTAASMILRGWIVALSIFLVGLNENDAGLAAAVLVISLFSIYFAMQFALRPMEGER